MSRAEYQVIDTQTNKVVATYSDKEKADAAAEILGGMVNMPTRFEVKPTTPARS